MEKCKIVVKKNVIGSDVKFEVNNPTIISKRVNTQYESYIILDEPSYLKISVSKDGYETYTHELYVSQDITLTPQLKKYLTLTINTYPEDADVVIIYNNNKYVKKVFDKIIENTEVYFIVSKRNMQAVSDTRVLNEDLTLEIHLLNKMTTDADIAACEGATTDKLNNINLLTGEQFAKLSPEEQERYIQYDPKLSNFTGVNYTQVMTDTLTDLYFMSPIASKISTFTNGTLDDANFYFMQIIKQLEPIVRAASKVNDQIRQIRKAASKVGLEPLIDILFTILKLISCVATLVAATTFNPNNTLDQYIQAFKDIDFVELLKKTVGQTVPQLQYVIDAMQNKTMPSEEMKDILMDKLGEMMEISGITQECMEMLMQIQDLFDMYRNFDQQVMTVINLIILISSGGTMMSMTEMIKMLKADYAMIKDNLGKNKFFKNINKCKNNINDALTSEKQFIDSQDLEYLNEINNNSNINEGDYKEGYNSALENAKNGESEEEMRARINKYAAELERLGKDYKSYVDGYSFGWSIGNMLFRSNFLGLESKEQEDSYNNGYYTGEKYASIAYKMAENYVRLGDLVYIVDIDNHIHDSEYNPIGRIGEDNIIYSFPDENVIGKYIKVSSEIELNNKRYILSNGLIFDPTIYNGKTIEEIESLITEEKILEMMEIVYKYMVIMIERGKAPDNNINPYYSRGWKDGYKDKIEEQSSIEGVILINQNGTSDGYEYARQGKSVDQLTDIIEESDNNYYDQGLVTGYNKYIAEYNTGYSYGWTNSYREKNPAIFQKNGTYYITEFKPIINNTIYNEKRGYIIKYKISDTTIKYGFVEYGRFSNNEIVYELDDCSNILGTLIIERTESGNNATVTYKIKEATKTNGSYKTYDLEWGYEDGNKYLVYSSNNIFEGYFKKNEMSHTVKLHDKNGNIVTGKKCFYAKVIMKKTDDTSLGYYYGDEIIPYESVYKYNNNVETVVAEIDKDLNIIDIDGIDPDKKDEYKKAVLMAICEIYVLDYNDQKSKSESQRAAVFRGCDKGWEDYYDNIQKAIYKETYTK